VPVGEVIVLILSVLVIPGVAFAATLAPAYQAPAAFGSGI
jgi:hypothetical protein